MGYLPAVTVPTLVEHPRAGTAIGLHPARALVDASVDGLRSRQ